MAISEGTDVWRLERASAVSCVSSPLLTAAGIVLHGVTTRHGNLNLSFRTESDVDRVLRNRSVACAAFGADLGDLVVPEQVHAAGVTAVSSRDRGRGAADYESSILGADALVTNDPGILLGITIADCLPVFLVDPVRHATGLAHSGWRGTAGEIAVRTLDLMTERFGTDPATILAAIGPGIQADCYEVDERVFEGFPSRYHRAFRASRPGHWNLDLRAAVRDQLIQAGVPAGAISVCEDCTHCRSDLYFSHRGEGAGAGRMGGFVRLKP